MSRARLDQKDVTVKNNASGAFYLTDKGYAPIGIWSYHLAVRRKRIKRPLYVFQDGQLYGGEKPTAYTMPTECPSGGGREWNPFTVVGGFKKEWSSTLSKIEALAVAKDSLYLAVRGGSVKILSRNDGKPTGDYKLPTSPVWDGLAVAYGLLYASTQDGQVVCLGESPSKVPSPGAEPSFARRPQAKPQPGRSTTAAAKPSAKSVPQASADLGPLTEKLQKRVIAESAKGAKPEANMKLFNKSSKAVRVLSADEKGLVVKSGSSSMTLPWKLLNKSDLLGLAQAFVKRDSAADLELLAGLYRANGRSAQAEQLMAKVAALKPGKAEAE
jgi:hypothetical protein